MGFGSGSGFGPGGGGGGGGTTKTVLTADTTWYVNADSGNDSNPGTAGSPFLTVTAALEYVVKNVDCASFRPIIELQDATAAYGSFVIDTLPEGARLVEVRGATTTGHKISAASGVLVTVNKVWANFRDLHVQFGGNSMFGFAVQNGGFGSFAGTTTFSQDATRTGCYGTLCTVGSAMNFSGTVAVDTINLDVLYYGQGGAFNLGSGMVYNFTGSPAWGIAGLLLRHNVCFSNATPTVNGTITGKRHDMRMNSAFVYISANDIPGSIAGTAATGAVAAGW